MSNKEQNNENEYIQSESTSQTRGNSSSSKKLSNQLYQSAQFDAMPSYMNKSSIGSSSSQTQVSNKAFQERLNKSGIFFKNGTLVNITDIDIDGTQRSEKDVKIRDLEDKEAILKKSLREIQAKLEKDIAILNQKLEFAELELKETKQKIKDSDEFFRLFEINDLRYQQHPIFKQKFAQLNEMHNQQIAAKQREIDYLRSLMRQYNEPTTLQSSDSLHSMQFSQNKQPKTNQIFSSSQKEAMNSLDEGVEFDQDNDSNQTPTKQKKRSQLEQTANQEEQDNLEIDNAQYCEEQVKRASNKDKVQNGGVNLIEESNELQITRQQLQFQSEECEMMKKKVSALEADIVRYEEIYVQNESNKQIIADLEEECRSLRRDLEEITANMKQSAVSQEEMFMEQLRERDQTILSYEEKCEMFERQQQDLLERAKSEQTALLQTQLNQIIAERETAIQEYYEQEYLNKLEFYEKKHTEILEENQKTFEEQMYSKEQSLLNQVQQSEQFYEENLVLKQLEFDQKLKSYELQYQTKTQELITQEHAMTAALERQQEQAIQIERLTETIENHQNENEELKQALEKSSEKHEKNDYRSEGLQKECEQQHQLILKLEHEIQQSTEKAQVLFSEQIKDLEAVNQTYQLQIKELENKLALMTSKFNNQVQQNQQNQLNNSKTDTTESTADKNIDEEQNNGLFYRTKNPSNLNETIGDMLIDSNEQNNLTMFSATNISYNLGKINSNPSQQVKLIQQLQGQLQQQQVIFQGEQEKIQKETTQLQQHIKQLEYLLLENRDAYYKERTVLENNMQNIRNENQDLLLMLKQEQQNSSIQELSQTKNQLLEANFKLSQAEEARKSVQSSLDKLIEQQSKKIESEMSSNQILLSVKNNEINEYKIRIEVLQNQLKESENLTKKAQSNVALLEIEKNELLQQVNFLENQQQQTHEQIAQEYENELQSLSGQLHDQIQEFSEERQRFLDTIESLQQSIRFQNSKNQELIAQCEQIEQEEGAFEQQQEIIRIIEDKLREQDNYIVERENFYVVEMQKKEKTISDMLNQIHILEMNRKEMMDEVEQEQERLLAQMQNQRMSQVSQSQSESITSKQFILALQQERDYLSNKIQIIESQKESLNQDYTELKQKFEDQQNQEESVKKASLNKHFGYASFKSGSNCASFTPQTINTGSSPNSQQMHKRGSSISQQSNITNNNNNNNNQGINNQYSSNQQNGGSQNNIQMNSQYDNGQYLNTSQFGGGLSNYMSNSVINTTNQNILANNGNHHNGIGPSTNSMAQSSIFSTGQSFIQNNNHIIFGSVNHSSLYGLSQAQMLEIIERAYMERLQQQQLYFEQKFRKEREENLKRSKEPTLIAEKKKLQQENEKLNKEMQQLRIQKQLGDEFNSIKGREHQILQDTAKLCYEKSRSKNRPTRDTNSNRVIVDTESEKIKDKLLSVEKKCFDLNQNKQKMQMETESMLNGWDKQQKLYENKIRNLEDQIQQGTKLDLSSYFSPNKILTDGDIKKKTNNSTKFSLNQPATNNTQITSITTMTTTTTTGHHNNHNQNNNNNNNNNNLSKNTEAGSIIVTRQKLKKQLPQTSSSSHTNQNIAPITSSISSSTSSEVNYSKHYPTSSSLPYNQQNMNAQNKGSLQQSNSSQANNYYTKAYGAKDSTLISINSNSDIFKSNIFNSNNTSNSFLKNSNLNESFLKNTPNHNISTQSYNQAKVNQSNSILSVFPHRESTPTTLLKKSYINFDQSTLPQPLNVSSSTSNLNINSRMQRSITENKLFNPTKLNITSQKY